MPRSHSKPLNSILSHLEHSPYTLLYRDPQVLSRVAPLRFTLFCSAPPPDCLCISLARFRVKTRCHLKQQQHYALCSAATVQPCFGVHTEISWSRSPGDLCVLYYEYLALIIQQYFSSTFNHSSCLDVTLHT